MMFMTLDYEEKSVKKLFGLRFFACVLIVFSIVTFSVAAQEQLAEVYGEIDAAFKTKSFDQLNQILSQNFGSEYYSLYESYSLKKTRQLIIEGDLDNARSASLIVIDNNLENFDAVELYSYIDKAILNKEVAAQKEAEKKALEEARLAAQREKTKTQVKKTFNTTETSSGNKVYTSEVQDSYSPLNWTVSLGIADVLFQSISDPGSNAVKYGLAIDVDMVHAAEQFFIGGDLFGNFEFLSFSKENKDIMATTKLVPKISFPVFTKHLFIRAGFGAYFNIESGDTKSFAQKNFFTPLAGLGFENIPIGKSVLKMTAEYCIGSCFVEEIDAAFDLGASILFPLSASEHTKVGVRLGASDLLMLKKENGIENRLNAILSIGVGNVDR